jgi:hypothetical protein
MQRRNRASSPASRGIGKAEPTADQPMNADQEIGLGWVGMKSSNRFVFLIEA